MGYILLMSISLFLLALCIYLYKKTAFSKPVRFLFSFGVSISILFFTLYGVANYFTGNGITSAVVYHVRYGLSGAGFLEYLWLISISLFSVLLGICLSLWLIFKKESRKDGKHTHAYLILLLLFLSLLLNPVTAGLKKYVFEKTEELKFDEDSEFYKYYKVPELEQIGKAKNLVFIYSEGLERTYFNEILFPNLIKNLREIESKSVSFTNISQDKYSSTTIGGMVASQCGFPLISSSHVNSMSGMDAFLESAICIGDLLHKEGYYLTYYGGASLNFAGKGKFFSTHKFDEVKGREEFLPKLQNPNYRTWWGLYDDSLFDLTYNNFIELSENQNKFAMFLLTLDTHHPNGNPSKSCNGVVYKDGANPMLNAVACSDYLIASFIEKIRQSEYSDKTVIVVVSDHISMRNAATELLKEGDRKNLFLINEPDSVEGVKIDKPGLTLDIGSTVLPFIGYKGEIGLGRDIINLEDSDSRIKNILNNLTKFEPYILQFWNFPKIENFIKIDLNQKKIFIDNKGFRFPILVELNDQLETKLKFEFDLPEEMGLNSHISKIDKNEYFLLIESCDKINNIVNTTIDYLGFCLLSGQTDKYSTLIKLASDTEFSAKEIREITGISSQKLMDNFKTNQFLVKRIAHAGGGIDGKTYTNSIDALDNSIKEGFSYFEIDFIFTEDEQLVCLHDWNTNFEKIFGFKAEERLTLNEFKQLVSEKSKFHVCTFQELVDWMEKNPDSYLVTDIKEENIKALKIISNSIPDFEKRVIPQIYHPEEFNKVKRMGYDQIIWTLYRYNGANEDVLSAIKQFNGSFAITMPKGRARSSLPTQLANLNIPTYTHTVNSIEEQYEFVKKYNITEIYTDFLGP